MRIITFAEYAALPRKIATDVQGYCDNKSCVVREVYLDTGGEAIPGPLACNARLEPLKFVRTRSRVKGSAS